MTDKQVTEISRRARHLLTDLEQVLGVQCTEAMEQQALQLITESFTDAAPLLLGAKFATLNDSTAHLHQNEF